MTLTQVQLERVVTSLGGSPDVSVGAERRREPRISAQGEALIVRCDPRADRRPFAVTLRDVSASGIGLRNKEQMQRGERFILLLPAGMHDVAKGVLCTVAFCRRADEGFEIGASFTSLIQPAPEKVRPTTADTSQSTTLPVPQLLKAFREQLKGVLNERDLQVIQSIEQRATTPREPGKAVATPHCEPPKATSKQPKSQAADSSAPPRSQSEARQLLTRDDCIKRAEQAMQARTLSGVVAQVISLSASPRGDLSDLTALIVRDPMLSARILQAANSVSYTSTRGVVATIPEAVRNIGCAAVRDIAATLGVFDAMPPSEPDGFNPLRCWQHSFAVANLCQRLANEQDKGPAYIVGLCHDLGEILFHTHFAAEYRQVVEVQEATGKRRDQLERSMLGMTHGELVSTILRCLGLPDVVRSPIDEYHGNGTSGRALSNPLARLLRLADLYANGVLLASSGQSPVNPLSRPECRAVTGNENPDRPAGVALRGEVLGLTAMLARLSAKDEAALMSPLYPKRQVKVLLARDPSLSTFDPVAVALDALADVTVQDSLPRSGEMSAFGGVVVLSRSTSAAGFTAPEITKAVGDSVPTFWLTGRVDGAVGGVPASLVPTLWPTPLSQLAGFIQRLDTPDAGVGPTAH